MLPTTKITVLSPLYFQKHQSLFEYNFSNEGFKDILKLVNLNYNLLIIGYKAL